MISQPVEFCSGHGQHHTANPEAKNPKPYIPLSMASIMQMMADPKPVPKEQGQWVIFTDYTGDHARNAEHLRSTGALFYALWGDIDEAQGVTAQDVLNRAAFDATKTETHVYTSRSATEENQKCRIIVPLAEPVDAVTFEIMQEVLNNKLESEGLIPDRATQTCNQLCYLPNRGAFYWSGSLESFDSYDTLHPSRWAKEVAAIVAERQAEAEARQVRMAASAARYAELVATQGVTPIHACNEAYGDPRDLLLHYGGKAIGNRVISPNSSSGSAGVTFKDGKWFSSHGSDVSLGLGRQSDSGRSCWGDSFDLVCFFEFGNDRTKAVKEMAEKFQPEANKQRQINHRREHAKKVEAVLFNAVDQQQAESPTYQHPLTKIVDLSAQPKPPNWVLPNFIAEGLVMIAGGHGVGKTTALLPLAMAVAGVHDSEYRLAPKHWRHVVYITEDIHQAQRIMTGYGEHLDWNNKDIFQNMRERVHVVEAHRMSASIVARAGAFYREKFSRTVTTTAPDGQEYTAELLPLIVIDTMAATIELENENDNSEASQAVAALKQQFEGLPTWIIGHVAKANLGRSESVTLRGAGAFEADANQVLYLVQDEQTGARWLTRGKTRFESPWQELEIKSDHRIITVTNQFGDAEELVLRWSIASPPDDSRAERAEKAKTEHDRLEAEELKQVILTNVAQRYAAGSPLNKTALRDVTGRSAAKTSNAIATLIADAWLHEIEVPAKERLKNKHSFLVALDDQERAEFLESGVIPEAKLWIPESWKKQQEAG